MWTEGLIVVVSLDGYDDIIEDIAVVGWGVAFVVNFKT